MFNNILTVQKNLHVIQKLDSPWYQYSPKHPFDCGNVKNQ